MGCPAEVLYEVEPYLDPEPHRRHLYLVPRPREWDLPVAAIARVQANWGDTGGTFASAVAATWGSTTTSGNLLVAIVSARATGTNTPTFTAPSGWASAPPTRTGATGGSNHDPSCQIFYIANCGARSGSESFNIVGSTTEAEIYLLEYSGADTSAPYDTEGNISSDTATTNATTGTTGAITASNSLCIAGVACSNQLRTFSTPQNGYTLVRQDVTSDVTNASGIAVGLLEKIGGTAGSTETTGLTINTSARRTGVLAVFKPASGGSTKTIAGSSAGVATASGAVNQTNAAVAGSSAGVATAAGSVAQTFAAVSGSSAGAATASGAVPRTASVAGSSAGVASCSGSVNRTASVSGSATGTATATGTLDPLGPPVTVSGWLDQAAELFRLLTHG